MKALLSSVGADAHHEGGEKIRAAVATRVGGSVASRALRRVRRLRQLEARPPRRRQRRLVTPTQGAGIVPPSMEWLFVIVPFVVVGLLVIFYAFSGGGDSARQAARSPRGGMG